MGRAFVDHCISRVIDAPRHGDGVDGEELDDRPARRQIDECLQLFGGYGYMLEYPVARAFIDARVQPIYAGSNEIMKEIVARSLERE